MAENGRELLDELHAGLNALTERVETLEARDVRHIDAGGDRTQADVNRDVVERLEAVEREVLPRDPQAEIGLP